MMRFFEKICLHSVAIEWIQHFTSPQRYDFLFCSTLNLWLQSVLGSVRRPLRLFCRYVWYTNHKQQKPSKSNKQQTRQPAIGSLRHKVYLIYSLFKSDREIYIFILFQINFMFTFDLPLVARTKASEPLVLLLPACQKTVFLFRRRHNKRTKNTGQMGAAM